MARQGGAQWPDRRCRARRERVCCWPRTREPLPTRCLHVGELGSSRKAGTEPDTPHSGRKSSAANEASFETGGQGCPWWSSGEATTFQCEGLRCHLLWGRQARTPRGRCPRTRRRADTAKHLKTEEWGLRPGAGAQKREEDRQVLFPFPPPAAAGEAAPSAESGQRFCLMCLQDAGEKSGGCC